MVVQAYISVQTSVGKVAEVPLAIGAIQGVTLG